jgi:hypothetical protein
MTALCRRRHCGALVAAFLSLFCTASLESAEVLIADRLTDRILRYSESGSFLGVLLSDSTNLDEPNGMALSLDSTRLYVASRNNSRVVQYDYNGTSATNPTVVVNSGISVPSSILFNANGSRLYVSNLGALFNGDTVGQFNVNPNGISAVSNLIGGAATGRTGMAWSPAGDLLVGSFQNGAVLRSSQGSGTFEPFITNPALAGVGNLLVNGNDLYVPAGFTGSVMKFNATTGAPDPAFTPISGLGFPASLALAPDGNGFLVGDLSTTDGQGKILRYGFDGALVGDWALNSSADPAMGFSEATGMLISPIPEPSTMVLGTLALVVVSVVGLSRRVQVK